MCALNEVKGMKLKMLTQNNIIEILKTYNINSQTYGPTIYKNENNIGICLDIKDSLFGYLTRIFIFKEKNQLNEFLKVFYWFKNNSHKYQINLSLNDYCIKNPKIIYKYHNKIISPNDLLNFDNFINNEIKEHEKEHEKEIYLKNIEELTNYLINLKQKKLKIKQEKNQLKILENDLKYNLLQSLILYYGREKTINKKVVTLDNITNDQNDFIQNSNDFKTRDLTEIKNYLQSFIELIKKEELDEKNLVNIYSNTIYKYNIEILQKQIAFVNSKINSEKKFNLKNSKIHNIDEELKSFLKTNIAPVKIETFIVENKAIITEKFKKIDDLKKASEIITGKKLDITYTEFPNKIINPTNNLIEQFNTLPAKMQNNLILYHSIYKPICNYIIDNNYPEIDKIITQFDFSYYYEELEKIIYNENNNHFLINYFSNINFNNINTYISSIIEICHDIEKTLFTIPTKINLFSLDISHKYKHLSNIPTKNSKYLIETNNKILFIPNKLIIDYDHQDIQIINDFGYYTKENIIEDLETVNLNKYQKKNTQKDDIIITNNLILVEELKFNKSHLEGEL